MSYSSTLKRYSTSKLTRCAAIDLPPQAFKHAFLNAIEYLERWFKDPSVPEFKDTDIIFFVKKYDSFAEVLKTFITIYHMLERILECRPGNRCANHYLCPTCCEHYAKYVYRMIKDMDYLSDPSIGFYVHRRVFELPRGVYTDAYEPIKQINNPFLMSLSDDDGFVRDILKYLNEHHMGCYANAIRNPVQMLYTMDKIMTGRHIYNSTTDYFRSITERFAITQDRKLEIHKRIRSDKATADGDDSLIDICRLERSKLNRVSCANAAASRIIIYPVVPYLGANHFPLVRVQKDTLMVLRKKQAEYLRQHNRMFQTTPYKVMALYPDLPEPFYYREAQMFVGKRIATKRSVFELLTKLFRSVNYAVEFLPEELIMYMYAMHDMNITGLAGDFKERIEEYV